MNAVKYSAVGQVTVGANIAVALVGAYYFPNRRGFTSVDLTTGASEIGIGTLIRNGSSATQVWPHVDDLCEIGYRITHIDDNTAPINPVFFTPSVQFWVSNYKCVTRMVNQSNSQVNVHVYTCELRRDLLDSNNSLYTIMSRGLFEKANELDPAGYTSGAFINSTNYMRDSAITPFDSSKFLGFVKIKTVRKITMNAGDIRTVIHGRRKAERVKPGSYMDLITGTQNWRSGVKQYAAKRGAVFQFFKITGQPSNDVTGALLNITSPRVDFNHIYSFNYRYIVETGAVTTRFSATGLSPGVMQIMGEATDTPITSANA